MEIIRSFIKHSILVILSSYITTIFIISVFGEFVVYNEYATEEFLTVLVAFATIYVSFLWSKK